MHIRTIYITHVIIKYKNIKTNPDYFQTILFPIPEFSIRSKTKIHQQQNSPIKISEIALSSDTITRFVNKTKTSSSTPTWNSGY